MVWKILLPLILGLAAMVIVMVIYGDARWRTGTGNLRARLAAERFPSPIRTYHPQELSNLPAPVQGYFCNAIREGQPLISAVTIEHTGTFNMSEIGEKWRPFRSTQRIITAPPSFDWDARIWMMPGLPIHVHDSYVGGEGILKASLLGLVPVMQVQGAPELAHGELMRYLAEACWYPTALLPSQGIRWEAVDDTSALATLATGGTSVTLQFRFAEDGRIESVRSEARGRMTAGRTIPTPWEGRWGRYEVHDGIRIPVEGEVAWILPQGPAPYWRGRITRIEYEFAAGK